MVSIRAKFACVERELQHAASNQSMANNHGKILFRQTHQSNTPLDGSPGGLLQQDLTYAQGEAMYRRPTVYISQPASYGRHNYEAHNYDGHNLLQLNTPRVVPPPAHNGSNRQVNEYIQGVCVPTMHTFY